MRYRYGDNGHNGWVGMRNASAGSVLLFIVNVAIRVIA